MDRRQESLRVYPGDMRPVYFGPGVLEEKGGVMTFWRVLNNVLSGHIPSKGYKPYTDKDGITHALSGTEALDATVKGQTAEGNATFAAVRVGYDKYKVQRIEFDNSDLEETKPQQTIKRSTK